MVRNYKRKTVDPMEPPYTQATLQEAVQRVKSGEPCKKVARFLGIPHRTLRDHVSGARKTSVTGRKPALLPEEELTIAQHLATFSDFGYAFDKVELKLFVQSFLQMAGRTCPYFKDNLPGDEWVRSFMDRHKKMLSNRVCQNISRARASVSVESVSKFFNNLEHTLHGIPPEHSDETDASHLVSPILIDRLRELRESNTKKSNRGRRGKAILV